MSNLPVVLNVLRTPDGLGKGNRLGSVFGSFGAAITAVAHPRTSMAETDTRTFIIVLSLLVVDETHFSSCNPACRLMLDSTVISSKRKTIPSLKAHHALLIVWSGRMKQPTETRRS
jgi:hypothetical protein